MSKSVLTDEEVADILRRISIVRPLIITHVQDTKREKEYVRDRISCPICEIGMIDFTYHGHYNRHIQAECTTSNCVSWIE